MTEKLSQRIDEADERSPADELLDDLMPPEFDWRGVVRRHPIPSLVVAAAAGYWLGSNRRSSALIDAFAGFAVAGIAARLGGGAVEDDEAEDPFEGRDPLADGDDMF
ncbi:MAG TPA: hypothetical protein VLA66_03210 [Thermoanaerobaculia bacterium]|nr:hypothetical protein [Thermoanaerobaculia bacterium]